MLPWLVIPLVGLWALPPLLAPAIRFEITSPMIAWVFVPLVTLSAWRVRMNVQSRFGRKWQLGWWVYCREIGGRTGIGGLVYIDNYKELAMCILPVIQMWSRRVATMLPWLVIPLIGLWAVSPLLAPAIRFEITSPMLAWVFVLLVTLFAWRVRMNVQSRFGRKWQLAWWVYCREISGRIGVGISEAMRIILLRNLIQVSQPKVQDTYLIAKSSFMLRTMRMKMVMRELAQPLHFMYSVEFWRMAVFWTISLLASYLQLFCQRAFRQSSDAYPHCRPPRNGPSRPLCIITGATSGLGAAAAYALSKEGFFIVLVGRSSKLLRETVERIKKQNEDAQLKVFEVDISSFQSILKFKSSLEKWLLDSFMHSSIQLLINNAGILATSHRLTVEGYDQMMAANYIGAFSLTKFLLPLLRNSPVGSRIVNVTSFTHRSVFSMQVDKETVAGKCFSKSKLYPYAHIYEHSKLCILLFSYQLHRQLLLMDKSCRVSVNAADPGAVQTNIMREIPSCLSHVTFVLLKLLGLLQSPNNGVSSILDAALAPPETSGVYFFGGKGRTLNSSALSHDIRLAEKLWTTSCNLFEEMKLASEDKEDSFHERLEEDRVSLHDE
ncbi:uncharacterized protein LOC110671948 isoform X2 [Hevea brasiliensis]|nr:uncharacterized protein LOC110671948 isoform X2 [Hevea brasiliensis]XP_021690274.2 uncharacterized protein LOC110671948 isoform X2 [Hevea brasiliensis]